MLSNTCPARSLCSAGMVQLRHVEYFVATVDAGSVSAAARAVHVTQPALSRQLRQLEDDLGVALFDREAGRLTLSRTGRALLPAARDLIAAAATLGDSARYHRAGGVERLTVAAPTVTLTDVVSPFVAGMSPDEPVIDVRSADGETPADMLRAGADLAITSQRPGPPYVSRTLAVLPVWACVRRDHPWAGRARVPLGELVGQVLVVPPHGYGAREALETAQSAAGTTARALVETGNGTIAQALAAAGRGVAVVSDEPRFDLHALTVDLGDDVLSLRLVAAWDGRSVASGALAALAERLAAWTVARYGAQH
jgi:LysR family transcriptional regulator, benzoate and cis,cis-muconate-responsive activator of ben and cat genes